MIRLSWLSEQDPLWIMLILMAAMMLAAELGYRVGRWWHPRSENAARDHFGAIRNSMLGLLALLLAFSFGASAQRYDVRRQLVIEDAIPLRALYLRSTLLAQPQRAQFLGLLRQYVDLRADSSLLHRDVTPADVDLAEVLSQSLFRQMWDLVRTLAQHEPPAQGADEMLKLLIDASSVNSKRVQAYISHVPDPIIWLLLGTAVGSLATVGYSGGLAGHRGIVARVLFSLVVCGTTFIDLELDRPARGALASIKKFDDSVKDSSSDQTSGAST